MPNSVGPITWVPRSTTPVMMFWIPRSGEITEEMTPGTMHETIPIAAKASPAATSTHDRARVLPTTCPRASIWREVKTSSRPSWPSPLKGGIAPRIMKRTRHPNRIRRTPWKTLNESPTESAASPKRRLPRSLRLSHVPGALPSAGSGAYRAETEWIARARYNKGGAENEGQHGRELDGDEPRHKRDDPEDHLEAVHGGPGHGQVPQHPRDAQPRPRTVLGGGEQDEAERPRDQYDCAGQHADEPGRVPGVEDGECPDDGRADPGDHHDPGPEQVAERGLAHGDDLHRNQDHEEPIHGALAVRERARTDRKEEEAEEEEVESSDEEEHDFDREVDLGPVPCVVRQGPRPFGDLIRAGVGH